MEATPVLPAHAIEAFRRAVDVLRGQENAAELIGVSQSSISRRLRAGMPLWAESVLQVEAATGVSRHELRPDIYPIEPPVVSDGHAPNGVAGSGAVPVSVDVDPSSIGTGDPLHGLVA